MLERGSSGTSPAPRPRPQVGADDGRVRRRRRHRVADPAEHDRDRDAVSRRRPRRRATGRGARRPAPCAAASGSATHSCTPRSPVATGSTSRRARCRGRPSSGSADPGRTSCSLPTLSWCSTSPLEQPGHRLQAGVRVRRHPHRRLGRVGGPVVVDEAPRPDRAQLPVRQGAAYDHRAGTTQRHLARLEDPARRGAADGGQPAGRLLVGPALEVAHAASVRP